MVQTNDLQMPVNMENLSSSVSYYPEQHAGPVSNWQGSRIPHNDIEIADNRPVILPKNKEDYDSVELMEEQLSIDHMEKELILKALKKYNGKRKDAAHELGISERTLYRKIKQFDIEL